jgi:hypothetical protein
MMEWAIHEANIKLTAHISKRQPMFRGHESNPVPLQ